MSKVNFFENYNEEKIQDVLNGQSGKDAVIFAMFAEKEKNAVKKLQKECAKKNIKLLGMVFPSLLDKNGFHENGVLLYAPDKIKKAAIFEDVPLSKKALSDYMKNISASFLPEFSRAYKSSLYMVFDAMLPNIASFLDILYEEMGSEVNYVGINAGSETFLPMPCLFDNEREYNNSVLMVLFDEESETIIEHGYTVPEKRLIATSASGNKIVHIDWRPAFEVYKEVIRESYSHEITKDTFYENSVHFPFGIILASGEILVRIPVKLEEDGSLFCVGEIPENSMITLLKAPDRDKLETPAVLMKRISKNNKAANFLYYCAGRRMHMRENAVYEIKELARLKKDFNFFGALTLGEAGSLSGKGYPAFHNGTLVFTQLS
ncbi:MAG: FIST C-terminal domain-containing protein [Spirochaetia bacterium]|nr:FIST C-terminal domain-containing protein [Spirochaetia bacterium]